MNFLLGILRVSDFVVLPQGLRHHALLHVGKESLEARNVVAILAPPDALVTVQFKKPLFRKTPVVAGRRASDNTPRRAGDRIGSLAIVDLFPL